MGKIRHTLCAICDFALGLHPPLLASLAPADRPLVVTSVFAPLDLASDVLPTKKTILGSAVLKQKRMGPLHDPTALGCLVRRRSPRRQGARVGVLEGGRRARLFLSVNPDESTQPGRSGQLTAPDRPKPRLFLLDKVFDRASKRPQSDASKPEIVRFCKNTSDDVKGLACG